ncbi:sortase family protein [Bifidobacterium pseudolongum subsp. globosum]|uniref:Sortase family protein n=1 Tax=Bifidobacterium pseudolongum subsp. globosum TaxID=1690 RepID=A0A4Q5A0A6_9BIFI|nr:class C sortase [Bifidobacterium pseudolongum]RYQ09067.1 sortase family protein [Bifidobacterium pseudolongum subsp. globosum]
MSGERPEGHERHAATGTRHAAWFAPRIRADLRHQDTLTASFAIIGWACYILAALMLSWVVGALIHNDIIARSVADDVASAPAAWPAESRRKALESARDYNNALQTVFAGRIPADAQGADGAPLETADGKYANTLDVDGNGAMARLRIPKISVNIPVYHTTLDNVLDKGAGHIYGTAMPVGDAHTYSVLAAHSGGVQGMLFTRLNEMKRGDVFYLDVLGGEHGYRIGDIRTIKPDQMEHTLQMLRAQYANDNATVTMVTCTPIGVNTDRLLVTGVREPIPDNIPPADTQSDGLLIAIGVGLACFLVAILAAILVTRWIRHRRREQRASSGHGITVHG